MTRTTRPGVPHNVVAHTLWCVPIVWPIGLWLHNRTQPEVPTWGARLRRR